MFKNRKNRELEAWEQLREFSENAEIGETDDVLKNKDDKIESLDVVEEHEFKLKERPMPTEQVNEILNRTSPAIVDVEVETCENKHLDTYESQSLLLRLHNNEVGAVECTIIQLEQLREYLIEPNVDVQLVDKILNDLFKDELDKNQFNHSQMSFYEYLVQIELCLAKLLDTHSDEIVANNHQGKRDTIQQAYYTYVENYSQSVIDTIINHLKYKFMSNVSHIVLNENVSEGTQKLINYVHTFESVVETNNGHYDFTKHAYFSISFERLMNTLSRIINRNTNTLQLEMEHSNNEI